VDQSRFPRSERQSGRAKIDAGTGFADLARQRASKARTRRLAQLWKADLGKDRGPPTFALPSGGVTQAIKSTFGWVLLHVNKITRPSRSCHVKDSLRKDVFEPPPAPSSLRANAFDDASASGDSLAQAAARAGMRVFHVPAVDKNGMIPKERRRRSRPRRIFLPSCRNPMWARKEIPFRRPTENVYVIKVNGVIPPRLKPLASVRAAVAAAWTANDQKQRLSQMAGQLVREAETGKSLSPIAAKLHASVQSTGAWAATPRRLRCRRSW